jgi:hypothetical protein
MGKTLQQMIENLPTAQREAVEERSAVLIAEEHEWLRVDIAAGLRDLDEGKTSPFDEAAVERIKQRGREMLVRR